MLSHFPLLKTHIQPIADYIQFFTVLEALTVISDGILKAPSICFGTGAIVLISEAFELYRQNFIVMANRSAKTEESYQVACRKLVGYVGDTAIESLTFSQIRDWKISLDKKCSSDTTRGYIINIRVVLGYLRKHGHNVLDPELIPVPKRFDKVPEFISKEEVQDLIISSMIPKRGYSRVNRLRNGAMIAFLYASGIRVSELCNLDRDSIHDGSFSVVGKGGKARLCFIDERAQTLLNEYLSLRKDTDPALFLTFKNPKRVRPHDVQDVFRYLRVSCGLKKNISPHTLRHSFSTDFLRNNGNMRYLQVMLGHSSLQTTQQYTHVIDNDLEKAYREHHTV